MTFSGMCGVTNMDRIRNDRIRGTTEVAEISNNVQKKDNVMRSNEI